MAHVSKHAMGSVGNLGKHYERGKNSSGEQVKYKNQDIDPSLSHLNYNLAPERNMSHAEFIQQRTSEVKCLKRKDVKIMCSWIVTLPKDFPEHQERNFFEKSYKFLEKRYGGKENVISAYVHKDESQPHLHFAFIPVVKDKKKGHLKVSAKECLTRLELQTFHGDLDKELNKHFERDVGILNDATKEGNKSIDELKKVSATERLKEVELKSENILLEANKKVANAQEVLSYASEEKKRLESKLESYKELRGSVVPLKEKKSLISGKVKEVVLSKDVYDSCVSAQFGLRDAEIKKRDAEEKLSKVLKSTKFEEVQKLQSKNEELRMENRELRKQVNEGNYFVEKVKKVFEKFPHVKEVFEKALEKLTREKNHER